MSKIVIGVQSFDSAAAVIGYAKTRLSFSQAVLAKQLGVDPAILSKAKSGKLPWRPAWTETLTALVDPLAGADVAPVPPPADIRAIPLDAIADDPDIQQRVAADPGALEDYRQALQEGGTEALPPVLVFEDAQGALWLADGFHRLQAAAQAGLSEIRAEIRSGTRTDALRHAVRANAQHGVRRTGADKRRSVRTALTTLGLGSRSDRVIADLCRVGHPLVASVRRELEEERRQDQLEEIPIDVDAPGPTSEPAPPGPEPAKRTGRDGKARKAPKQQTPKADCAADARTAWDRADYPGLYEFVGELLDGLDRDLEGQDRLHSVVYAAMLERLPEHIETWEYIEAAQ